GCLAHLQCRLVDTHEAGDHLVLVGEVVEADASGGEPLLFFGGRYGRLA
ncbi:MAG TPA: flavin reductase, partial [Actinobacteria bacterium]|nr:flavin reductase [Actinomycetota bacterium]